MGCSKCNIYKILHYTKSIMHHQKKKNPYNTYWAPKFKTKKDVT